MIAVARGPHPPVWHAWLLVLTAAWMSCAAASANELLRTVDCAFPSENRPEDIRTYLYAHANPVMGFDPSGRWTLREVMVTVSVVSTLASRI